MENLVTWLADNRVIFTSIVGPLRVEDFPALETNVITLFEASTAEQVHVLTDISLMTTMPNVFQMSKLTYITHPKIGYFITQSRNPVEEFIGQAVGQMFKTKYKFVKTLDEGVDFLAQIDPTLPPAEDLQAQVHAIRGELINTTASVAPE